MARGTLVSELRTVPDDPAAVLDLVETQGWGDGFPVIPPTEERVQAMLEATPLPPRTWSASSSRGGARRRSRRSP